MDMLMPCIVVIWVHICLLNSLCLEKFLGETSDLVFVEFIANDGSEMDVSYTDNQKARFFERFLRKIMKQPSAPAVVMMQV
jgi:hypothetical protein